MLNKIKIPLAILLLLMIVFLPYIFHNSRDNVNAKKIDQTTVGYYQSTTCKISLFEMLLSQNFNNKNIYLNENNYVGTECYGKITGLDKSGKNYFVSIGTNTSFNFIVQSIIWISFIFAISKRRTTPLNFSIIPVIFVPVFFTLQAVFEERFYFKTNKYYDLEFSFTNYYLIGYFLTLLLICIVLSDIFKFREINIYSLIPFMYFIYGTYMGMNLNIFLIMFTFLGIVFLTQEKSYKLFNFIYFIFSIIWIFNLNNKNYFFDGDKLRGFINTDNNVYSLLYWIILVYLLLNGIIFLVKENNFDLEQFTNNFLTSGSLVTFLGILGSSSYVINFFNTFILGLNKHGMKKFESVAGNAWRGLSPSAEFIGEFYAVSIFLFFLFFKKNKQKINLRIVALLLINLFGLFRSNNFSAITTLILFVLLIYLTQKFTKLNKNFIFVILFFILISIFFVSNVSDYKSYSNVIIEEAVLHSDLFQYSDNYKNFLYKEKYFIEKDFNTLMMIDDNYQRASSSLLMLINLYTPNYNIPFIPNAVGILSILSLAINRTEMWGIFISKYNPSKLDFIFGYGPLQLSDYLFGHKVRLDVPENKISSLYLPHSSFLDLLLFTGFFGLLLILSFAIYRLIKNDYNHLPINYLLIFLVINLLKSDSILYLPTFTLLATLYIKIFVNKNVKS